METMWIDRLVLGENGWVWQPQQETFDLQKDFSIDEENINGEICRMGQLLVRYGSVAAEQEANLKRKEEYAKLVYAQVSGANRSNFEKEGVKVTDSKLSETVIQSDEYQRALANLHVLRADAVKSEHWWRSIIKKAELLNALAFRQNAEIRKMG